MTDSGTDGDTSANAAEGEGTSTTDGDDAADATLGASVVTIASDRTLAADAAGEAIETALERVDYELATREHVAPSHDRVQSIVLRMIERGDVDVVITAGATSVEPDDVALEAVEPLLDKELTTFSDLFTSLAYQEVGTRALAARTLAGIADGKPVFCLPGNADAARLGTEEIILSEAPNLVDLARDDHDADSDDAETGEDDGTAGK